MRLAVLAILAACHGPALPAVPGKGGPAWVELQTEHFTLWTDAPAARGRQLVRQIEHLRQVVLGVGFDSPRAEGRSLVIAMRDADEVGAFVPEQFIAYAWSGEAILEPMIVIPGRVAAAHPDDWRAWWLVGFALHWSGDEASAARDKACAILAKRPATSAPTNWCPAHP